MTAFRFLASTAAAMGLAAAAATGAAAQDQRLNIYNWSDYIAEDTIAKFEAETGIRVTYDVYDSNEVLEAKLLAGNSGYDIVVPTGNFLERQIAAGIYQPLDTSRLTNLGNLDPKIVEEAAAHDPGNAHGVVYMWGTNGIGYNVARVAEVLGDDAPTDSMDLIFTPEIMEKLSSCGVYFLDSPSEIFPMALIYLGLDPHSPNAEDYAKAEDLLMRVRPYVTRFHSSEYINALASGDICVAVGFSGDIFIAADRAAEAGQGVEIAYTIPKEGTLLWFDFMAIPADAPNPGAAHAFIDFMLRPEIIADVTNYVFYSNPNLASKPFIDEAILNDPGIYPSDEVLANLHANLTVPQDVERIRTRSWNRVKTGR